MAKKFDIHEWQAKYWLKNQIKEAEEFTPDLEDDDLKRSKIQQMMDKEKSKTPQDAPRGTLNNTIADLAEMYSYGEILDSLKVFYTDNGEQPYADMAKKHAKEFRDFLDNKDEDEMFMGDWGPHLAEEDLDEANVTGGGASFTTGTGGTGAYATPKAFSKGKKKKAPYRKSGYMGYSEPVKENEENEEEKEYSRDVEVLEKLIDDKINTKNEWIDMFQLLMAHSEEIRDLNDSQIKILLQQSLKDI